jgi:hypothetical protein
MMKVEFRCDICNDVVGPERPFVGFDFGLMGDHLKATDRFVARVPAAAERHICVACLEGLAALAKRTLSPGTHAILSIG